MNELVLDKDEMVTGEPLKPVEPILHRWKFMSCMMALTIIPMLVDIYISIKTVRIFWSYPYFTEADGQSLDKLAESEQAAIVIYFFLFAISIVGFCFWVQRANSNLHQAGLRSVTYSPGMSVGWFFIPVVNLVMSYKVMSEIDKASQALSRPEEYLTWQEKKTSVLLPFCFFSFLVSVVLFIYAKTQVSLMQHAATPYEQVRLFSYLFYFYVTAYILRLFSGITLILYTRRLTQLHNNHIELTTNG